MQKSPGEGSLTWSTEEAASCLCPQVGQKLTGISVDSFANRNSIGISGNHLKERPLLIAMDLPRAFVKGTIEKKVTDPAPGGEVRIVLIGRIMIDMRHA